MKNIFSKVCLILFVLQLFTVISFAQERFDIVTFSAPKGWQKSAEANAVQFTKQSENQVGIMMLFKALPTNKDSKTTFNVSWDSIVKELLTKVDAPKMLPVEDKNGWTIESGAAIGEKDGEKLVAMLISATGGGKVVNLLILYNSESFQTDVEGFISSINLPKVEANTSKVETNKPTKSNASLVGLWVFYNTESSGLNSNGFPMLTGGYMRREYLFKADGTYVFRAKDWLVYVKEILYVYETGKWSADGSQLTITPTQGHGEWWSKSASGRTSEWGNRVKASAYKLEKVSYNFEILYDAGTVSRLVLQSARATERDGRQSNNENSAQKYSYSPRETGKSLIDNPPR